MRQVFGLLGLVGLIAAILAAFTVAGYVLWWIVLVAVSRFPMIGRRHRHSHWDRLNRP